MSEYQYYEFRAVDRPLTQQQQYELRRYSTRATITASSFINEYHWGDFKGNPLEWMKHYFDAYVYSANWNSCCLRLRVPIGTLEQATLKPFTSPSETDLEEDYIDAFSVTRTRDYWILSWEFNDEPGENERFQLEDGPGWMGNLLPLRDELLRGDLRPLYLGWLARVCNHELGDEDIEPPVPAGLQTLTPAQTALVEFLLLDPDLVVAAATASPALSDTDSVDPDIDAWVLQQSPDDMRQTLRMLLNGRAQEAERGLRQRFLAWQRQQSPMPQSASRRRVADINAMREIVEHKRLETERQLKAEKEAKARAKRKQYLEQLAANADMSWAAIDKTLQRGTGVAYDEALKALKDLAEAMTMAGRKGDFEQGLVKLQETHGRRPAWNKRLSEAGIMTGEN